MNIDLAAELAQVRAALEHYSDYRIAPLPAPVDHQISGMFEALRGASEADRRAFAETIRRDDAYALIAYAERMSMLSARQQSQELLISGLVALGYALPNADSRTGLMVLALLHHSARSLGQGARAPFEQAFSYLVDPEAVELMGEFLRREPSDQSISVMGYQEIDGPSGVIYWQGSSDSVPEGLK